MQLWHGILGSQLPPPANLRKSIWRRSDPSPDSSARPQLKQFLIESQLPSISTHFKTISLPIADEWAHLHHDRRQTLFTACRQRLKRKYWRNTQFCRLNQLGRNPQVLAPTPPPPSEQLFIPPWDKPPLIQTVITPVDKRMSPSKKRELSLQTLASIPERTSKSLQMLRFEVESRSAMQVW